MKSADPNFSKTGIKIKIALVNNFFIFFFADPLILVMQKKKKKKIYFLHKFLLKKKRISSKCGICIIAFIVF